MKFYGERGVAADYWIMKLVSYFQHTKVQESEWCCNTFYYMEGTAADWFAVLDLELRDTRGDWNLFIQRFISTFGEQDKERQAEKTLLGLRGHQGHMNAYNNKFRKALLCCKPGFDKFAINTYLDNLPDLIGRIMATKRLESVYKAMEQASLANKLYKPKFNKYAAKEAPKVKTKFNTLYVATRGGAGRGGSRGF